VLRFISHVKLLCFLVVVAVVVMMKLSLMDRYFQTIILFVMVLMPM